MTRTFTPPRPVVQRTITGAVVSGMMVMRKGLFDPPASVGESGLTGKPWVVDGKALRQVASAGNQASAQPVKARFGTPSPFADGIGTYLGRWRMFRLSVDQQFVLADLHMATVAFRGGKSSIGQYLIDLIGEDHDAIGVSIRLGFIDKTEMQREPDSQGRLPLRVRSIKGADIVDESNVMPDDSLSVAPEIRHRDPLTTPLHSAEELTMANLRYSLAECSALQQVQGHVDQYRFASGYLLKRGIPLTEYVAAALRDGNLSFELSETMTSALSKKQHEFGAARDHSNPLRVTVL